MAFITCWRAFMSIRSLACKRNDWLKCSFLGNSRFIKNSTIGLFLTSPLHGSWEIWAIIDPSAASASARTVFNFMTWETCKTIPSALNALTRRILLMESPPKAKKLSKAPTSAERFKIPANAAAIFCSTSPSGFTYSTWLFNSGRGNCLRLTLPLGVKGMVSNCIYTSGTIYSARFLDKNASKAVVSIGLSAVK